MDVLKRCCVSILLAAVTVACATSGAVVDRLTVINATGYDLEISVTDADRDGWTPLGRVRGGETKEHSHVNDVGDVWIFRFEYPGPVDAGELRLTRDALEDDRWRVRVPDDVGRTLRRKGIEPSRE
jgi:hypothetical protein